MIKNTKQGKLRAFLTRNLVISPLEANLRSRLNSSTNVFLRSIVAKALSLPRPSSSVCSAFFSLSVALDRAGVARDLNYRKRESRYHTKMGPNGQKGHFSFFFFSFKKKGILKLTTALPQDQVSLCPVRERGQATVSDWLGLAKFSGVNK